MWINQFYKKSLKKALFSLDAEWVHNRFLSIGKVLGSNFLTRKLIRLFFNYKNKSLEQEILGINFKNPVGLSAGFDKDAEIIKIISDVGFGFSEVGSITGKKCLGNPKPRLWRLPKYKSIVVYYGLKNKGCEEVSRRLKDKKFDIPIGINVAKTNSPETVDIEKGIEDYIKVLKEFSDIGDYFAINITCPSAVGGFPFCNASMLSLLLKKVDNLNIRKPVFLKLSPDLTEDVLDNIFEVAEKYRIDGFIMGNLSKKIRFKNGMKGGISGKLIEKKVNEKIKYLYKKSEGKFIIIGCGGIFTAEDAYKKIRLGASLVQLITGMVYEGPETVKEINKGLVRLLEKDGFKNISEVVGVDVR